MGTFKSVRCFRESVAGVEIASCAGLPGKRKIHHSPTGYEWGSCVSLVQLDVAVRAEQRESLRMCAHFLDPHPTRLTSVDTTVDVVKVKRGLTPIVAANRTLSAKGSLQFGTPTSLLFSPTRLHAARAGVLPALIPLVAQEPAADIAEAITTKIDAGALVFFVRSRDLSALGAPACGDASAAI